MEATKKHKKHCLRFLVLLCAFLWLPLFCGRVLAHDPGLSAAEVRILADRIQAEVSFAPSDLERLKRSNTEIAEHLLEIKLDQTTLKLTDFRVQTRDANSVHFILEF